MTARHLSRRSSQPGVRRARLAATTLLAGLAALATITACGTGQYAQTASQVPGVPGTNANVGPNGSIQLRNVVVAYNDPAGYAAGQSAPLVVRVYNGSPTPVTLTGVEAAGTAASVDLTTTAPGAVVATPPPTAELTTSPGPTTTGSAAPTGSATPTVAPTTPAPPAGSTFPITIPPATWADLVPGQGPYLVLTNLSRALAPGANVTVTFQFTGGGQLGATPGPTVATIQVPIDLPVGTVGRGSPQPSEGEPGG